MHRMSRVRTGTLFAFLFASATSAFAGTVYVPLAMDGEIGGTRYQTQVWLANRSTVARRVETMFLETGQDGTARQGKVPGSVRVLNGASFLLGGVAPANKTGMLELAGPDPLVVTARLVGPSGLGATIPVVSSENLIAAGDSAHLLGLQRDGARVSNLGVINLGKQPAQCFLQRFRAGGDSIGNTVQATLPPLSHRQVDDLLAPETGLSAARATVSCNQPFYAYTVTYQAQTGELLISGPAAGTDSELETPGGGGGPAGALCGPAQAGRRCFDQPGTFFIPSRSVPTKRIELPIPNKIEYKKATVDIDVTIGPWFAKRPDGIHNFFWFAQGTNPDRIGYANVRGPGRNLVYVVHHIGYPKEVEGFRLTGNYPMQVGATYHISFSYDAANRLVEFTVKNSSGQVVVSGTNSQVGTRRLFTTTHKYLIDFGLHDEAADAPTYGWKYANLKVQFFE
jgi:hypothetical protein